ncbi:MAG TPA: nicotinate (nicotinamide) nucleotide adenylyltransferase [Ruminococcus sp.]|nr:nicotinate (nicotinamide) nucleotide adenylyltransferase [Ruminococcus sp.]HBN11087.1 nicotinate (nicotinamide) nucleotide adenylyltransferase [Ruminococcus sp.]HCR73834.1 nicotinate (nicotinamide) nucleotide adenylyltransferase [Ruminococcus sp.]
MRKTGIFGGSFNPVHNGHIHLAQSVMQQLELDRIILMPANIPPHKQYDDYIDGSDRLEMCRLASEGIQGIEVSGWEISQNNISYSYNTVMHFRETCPDDRLYLLAGSDMLLSFDTWFRYRDILAEAALAVVSREKNDSLQLVSKKHELEKYGEIIIVNAEPVVISSTQIRKSIKNHQFYSCYLDKKVVQYIKQKKLYGE